MYYQPPPSSKVPVRGAIGLALTIGGLALLFSFRPPGSAPGQATTALVPVPLATDEPAATDDLLAPAAASAGTARAVGEAVSTRWGDVQIVVTADGDDITSVQAVSLPARDRRSRQLSDRAEPVLRTQAIVTDRADVDVVSGATYTSRAYASSLQSALDQLGI